jgi:hypothetical protein
VCASILRDPGLYDFLLTLDRDLAEQVHLAGCDCGGAAGGRTIVASSLRQGRDIADRQLQNVVRHAPSSHQASL